MVRSPKVTYVWALQKGAQNELMEHQERAAIRFMCTFLHRFPRLISCPPRSTTIPSSADGEREAAGLSPLNSDSPTIKTQPQL
jgi:hypothetical protein